MNVAVHKTVEQLIKKNKRKGTEIEIKNLQTNNDGFNNNIAMFHLTYFHDEGVFSEDVVLKEFSGNLKLTKELKLLRSNSVNSFTKVVPLIHGEDDSHIRDRSFEWLKRRYELFVKHNGTRIKEAEEYLLSKGLSSSIL
ncbi:hypothetical protein ABEW00_03065 [Rossellomorea vietnamensis]|uniref:hypothetical protein n=1 Tax=Rossellomorea vietnamensis TaxID=218284 RepID=UPI003D2BF1FF